MNSSSNGGAALATRVFVRVHDGATRRESDEELLMLPPPPLTWAGVVSAMVQAATKQDTAPDEQAVSRARIFLLPTDPQGVVAELNARSLRFGIRDNDQFAICLHGEDYQRPDSSSPSPITSNTNSGFAPQDDSAVATYNSLLPSTVKMGGDSGAPPTGTIRMDGSSLMAGGRKGSKRVRSISGKMAAIKSLGDKGLISAEDRGFLKDLLLNNDSPALQDALDQYQVTGDFQAVKDLLFQELQNPSAKRNTGDWLPEGLIHDISVSFSHDDVDARYSAQQTQAQSQGPAQAQAPPANPFMYTQAPPPTSAGTPGVAMSSDYGAGYDPQQQQQQQRMSWGNSMAAASPHPHQQAQPSHQHPQQAMHAPTGYASSTPMGYAPAPTSQIHLPLRNRNSVNVMQRHRSLDGSGAAPDMAYAHPQHSPQHAPPPPSHGHSHGHPHPQHSLAGASTGYTMGPATPVGYGSMGGYAAADYGRVPYGVMQPMGGMGYNPYQQHPPHAMYQQHPHMQQQQPQAAAYGMAAPSPYGYGGVATTPSGHGDGSMGMGMNMGVGMGMPGYEYYAAGYGYMKHPHPRGGGGKWTTAPPMPSYPPPCSKEEKKEKIARWLKKRENRNWSSKPSYPVRHNIAKNRKRGEDGRFITKKRLAEMAAEEAARVAAGGAPREELDDQDGEGDDDQDQELDQDRANSREGGGRGSGSGSGSEGVVPASTAGDALRGMETGTAFHGGALPAATAVHM